MQETEFDPWVRKIPWRREWQPTPVFLPGKSHRQRSLAGNSLCMCAKSLQSGPTLCDPMDCSWPSSSVLGDSPDKNTWVGCHALLQGIFPTQGSNSYLLCLLHWQAGCFLLVPCGKPWAAAHGVEKRQTRLSNQAPTHGPNGIYSTHLPMFQKLQILVGPLP